MSEEVTVVAHMVFRKPLDEALPERLDALVAATRAEDGCLEYSAHLRLDEPGRVLFYERWRDQAALDAHSRSAHVAAYREFAGPRLAAAPELSLWRRRGA